MLNLKESNSSESTRSHGGFRGRIVSGGKNRRGGRFNKSLDQGMEITSYETQ